MKDRTPDDDAIEDVVLCLQEALKNAMRFSDSREPLEVDVELEEESVQTRVRDHGVGLREVPDVRQLAEGDLYALSGRGLLLMSRLSDEFELVSNDGVEVRMAKRIAGREWTHCAGATRRSRKAGEAAP